MATEDAGNKDPDVTSSNFDGDEPTRSALSAFDRVSSKTAAPIERRKRSTVKKTQLYVVVVVLLVLTSLGRIATWDARVFVNTFVGDLQQISAASNTTAVTPTNTSSNNATASTTTPPPNPIILNQRSENFTSLVVSNNETRDTNLSSRLRFHWSIPNDVKFDHLPLFRYCNWKNARDDKNVPWEEIVEGHVPSIGSSMASDESNEGYYRLELEMNSTGIHRESAPGTGNWVTMLYVFRMVLAQSSRGSPKSKYTHPTNLSWKSVDAETAATETVLPWLMGDFDSPKVMAYIESYWKDYSQQATLQEGKENVVFIKCAGKNQWGSTPVIWALPLIRYEMRRMAISLVGLPKDDPSHPAHSFASNQKELLDKEVQMGIRYQLPTNIQGPPLIPNVDLDDVAIHFRCGDVMASKHDNFDFLKFSAFARRIDPNGTKSIGIVTQPFKEQVRLRDVENYGDFQQQVCETVTRALKDYLEEKFPHAKVSIRNDRNETIPLAFSRLIMAKQSFSAPASTFSVFPVLASFGKGYHLKPLKKNKWLMSNEIPKNDAQVQIMEESQTLNPVQTKKLKHKDIESAPHHILQWFLNDTYVLPSTKK